MNTKVIIGAVFLLALSFSFMASRLIKGTQHPAPSKKENMPDKQQNKKHMANSKKVYIAGGCFWGMEDLFRYRKGILDTEVGYIGGENENPTYENHPGHAEGIEITFDTTQTSFEEILDYFFRIHNPTTVNQQGNDIGSSYRSAIFYQNEEEKRTAEAMIALVNQSNRWDGKVVTTLEQCTKFWPAEDYHQDYLVKNPNGYTCHFERFGTFLAR